MPKSSPRPPRSATHLARFVCLAAAGLVGQACDVSQPLVDAGIDAALHPDVTQMFDTGATDATSQDVPAQDVQGSDIPSVPFDGASGIGNGTCAETGSYCNAHEQCCSGLCATSTTGSGGTCALPTGGTPPTWPAPDGGASCLHPCTCPSNQHCCLNPVAGTTCGFAQQCSVLETCL